MYPFGYGLSYTSFDVGAPKLSKSSIANGDSVTVTVPVKNTGKVAGDEVVQIYIRDKVSSVTRSVKDLKAFRRITLKPGESRNVTFELDDKAFEMWNPGYETRGRTRRVRDHVR